MVVTYIGQYAFFAHSHHIDFIGASIVRIKTDMGIGFEIFHKLPLIGYYVQWCLVEIDDGVKAVGVIHNHLFLMADSLGINLNLHGDGNLGIDTV